MREDREMAYVGCAGTQTIATSSLQAEDSAMRKLLVLAAFAAVAACHRQSDTDVGQASPDTGRTTRDTAMTAPPSSGQTGQTGYGADSVGNRGDTAMVHKSVPDTAYPSTGAARPPSQTGDTGAAPPSQTQPSATGQTGVSSDSMGNRGDSAAVNRSVPDTSKSKSGWSQPSGQSATDSTRPPR
jgi:hypothetical protein